VTGLVGQQPTGLIQFAQFLVGLRHLGGQGLLLVQPLGQTALDALVGFAEALRSALREDPDIILVGELRDLETIRLALTAAETGHLVFGTLHTSSAAKTIDRIIDVFPAAEKGMQTLDQNLQTIYKQGLISRLDARAKAQNKQIFDQ
jgi:Tfp pilus assembly pilus retraction ATPase PilT